MDKTYKYTVCTRCFTYNHAPYILDALNGFVAQQTVFPVVYVIVDDASTDGEPQILRDYLKDNFNLGDTNVAFQRNAEYGSIVYAQHKENKNCYFAILFLSENHYGQKKSKIPYIKQWEDSAKYFALCEGDDYWTDVFKLQKQVDYMDQTPGCFLCVHRSNWDIEGNLKPLGCQYEDSCDISLQDSIQNGGLFIATASFLYRPECDRDWPKWRVMANIGDFPLQVLCGLKGTVHFIAETMCVYRFLHKGSWSDRHRSLDIRYAENEIMWMEELDKSTNYNYTSEIYSFLLKYFRFLFLNKRISFMRYLKNARKTTDFSWKRVLKDFFKVFLLIN